MKLLFSLMLMCAGCAAIGVAAHVAGPATVKARYVPEKMPMLVLAERYSHPSLSSIESEQLERFVIDELVNRDVAPMADHEKVSDLRSSDPARFRSMSIVELGRLAGAAQVLYITLQHSSVQSAQASEMMRGQAAALVRMVDVESRATLWPADGTDGYPVLIESPFVQTNRNTTEADVRRAVQRAMAEQIARLFYSYKPEN